MEALARTAASNRRLWKERLDKGTRLSYPFAIPVKVPKSDGRVQEFVKVRLSVETLTVVKEPLGRGVRYRIHATILDADGLTPIAVIYEIHSKEFWKSTRDAMRRGCMTATNLYDQLRIEGITQDRAKQFFKRWLGVEEYIDESQPEVREQEEREEEGAGKDSSATDSST